MRPRRGPQSRITHFLPLPRAYLPPLGKFRLICDPTTGNSCMKLVFVRLSEDHYGPPMGVFQSNQSRNEFDSGDAGQEAVSSGFRPKEA
jgi:hypothetical protein